MEGLRSKTKVKTHDDKTYVVSYVVLLTNMGNVTLEEVWDTEQTLNMQHNS